MAGRVVHPTSADYSFLSWCPDPEDPNHSPDVVSAKDVNWHPGLPLRRLVRDDFVCDRDSVRAVFERGICDLEARCAQEIHNRSALADLERDAGRLDPTQRVVYEVVSSWAQKQRAWRCRSRHDVSSEPPGLRLLLLGTAGTGKTHTAKVAIRQVRRLFGRYRSVLTLAFSGVAAANLGGGAQTIDSIFHTNAEDACEDLFGDGWIVWWRNCAM